MKTRIKIIIDGNEYLVESTYESGFADIRETIEAIVKQQILINQNKLNTDKK